LANATSNKKDGSFHQHNGLIDLREKLVKYCIWRRVEFGAETWTLGKRDQKHLQSFEMWCWRRMGKINWTHRVRNEEVLQRVKEERNILHNLQ
jgi:hypothetical protein